MWDAVVVFIISWDATSNRLQYVCFCKRPTLVVQCFLIVFWQRSGRYDVVNFQDIGYWLLNNPFGMKISVRYENIHLVRRYCCLMANDIFSIAQTFPLIKYTIQIKG